LFITRDTFANILIDDQRLKEARRLGKHRTYKETVTAALMEYIRRLKQLEILDLVGKIEYAEDYDYKHARKRTRR
jgi:hypothetical protein